MLLSEALKNFLIAQEVIGNSEETILYYKKRIGYFVDYLKDKDTSEISLNDYNSYALYLKNKITKKNLPLSSATIKTSLNAVKIFVRFLYNKQYIKSDFYKEIKSYKQVKKTIVVLSSDEIKRLLATQDENTLIGSRNLLVISLMLDSGLRVSEVTNLDVADINIKLGLIRVFGKGRKERLVPLTDSILKYYKKYIFLSKLSTGALFIDFDNNLRMTSSGISQILRRIKKSNNFVKLHPHFLRHTFATLFLVNGGDPVHLQLILGHETLYMTENYLHIANQMTMPEKKKYSPLTNIDTKKA